MSVTEIAPGKPPVLDPVTFLGRLRIAASGAFTKSVLDNPVVVKDFRTRMRGWKAFVVMGAYVALMATVMLIAYYAMSEQYANSYSHRATHVAVGRDLFTALTWAQAILLTLIIPSLCSGALTQELEKRTIEMIALSPLTSGQMVIGKQLASFLYTLILMVSSVPLAGICLMLGGLSPAEIWVTYLLLVAWAFALSSMGVMWSSLAKKTMTASGNTFGLSFLYFISTAIGGTAVQVASRYGGSSGSASPFVLLSPVWAPTMALQSADVCGVKVPLALAPLVLHVAYGVLFLLIAASHVRYKPAERALPIRLIILGIAIFTAWLGAGSMASRWAYGSLGVAAIGSIAISLLVQSVFAATIFATGVVKKREGKSMLQYAFSGRKVFKSDIGGAISFVVLLVAATFATYGITLSKMLKTYSASGVSGPPIGMPPRAVPPVMHGLPAADFWTTFYRLAVPLIVMSVAFAAIGVLSSALAKKRNSAAALVVLFAIVAFAGYGVIMMNYQQMMPNAGSGMSDFAALWPLTPFMVATGAFSQGDLTPSWLADAWIVCSAAYAAIGLIALALASSIFPKTGGVEEESP